MRGPIFAGVLAGLLVVLVILSAFVAGALGRPGPVLPSIALSSRPPLTAAPSPDPSTPVPTAAGSPTATARPAPTPSPTESVEPVGLNIGDRAPTLRLYGMGGAEIDTSLLAGQPLWINFMATWCPPCRDELPLMQRYQDRLAEEMTILVVDVGESEDVVEAFMSSLGVDLPVGLDPTGAAQREWGAYALPVHYWIDAEGRVAAFVFGGAGPDQFSEAVRTVLPGVELGP